ncbi:MAG: ATP synthase F1 subunit gamma [Christensenellales bacterium]
MGANIKNLRIRIKSVDSTLHLTTAMGLVASSKIRRAQINMAKAKEYVDAVEGLIGALTAGGECKGSVYMQQREGERTKLVVIAGDRGLAGGYNANVFRAVKEYEGASVVAIGKRACERFGQPVNSSERFGYGETYALAEQLCQEWKDGLWDRIGIVDTHYVSMMTQQTRVNWIFPLVAPTESNAVGMIFEPDQLTVLEKAVPTYVAGKIYGSIKESFASEVVARRTAMDSAGKNAQSMIDDLQLQYNRARQGTITQEITEIVAGSGN